MFGHPKSRPSRAAQRFFADRAITVAYHDLRRRAPTPGDLRRWIDRFGADALIDRESPIYVDGGMGYLARDAATWLDQFARTPLLLRLPLVRCGDELTVGDDPQGWKRLAAVARGS